MRAFVLMTAMPPTKGHKRLIDFARKLSDGVEVLICTQPGEPYPYQRAQALREATSTDDQINIHHLHKTIPQVPADSSDFWDMWRGYLKSLGFTDGDIIVASETYGVELAKTMNAPFYPYDINREILPTKATLVRESTHLRFEDILPEFQDTLKSTITIFGAESVGKTTLTKRLANELNGHYLFEYARPYLETVSTDITTASMTSIWKGQKALQEHAQDFKDRPFVFQDTDLFSTVGYWDFWDMQTPAQLVTDAKAAKSDLYIILSSEVAFVEDPIRYGGDKRESEDSFWVELCQKHGLNYKVVSGCDYQERYEQAKKLTLEQFSKKANISYVRSGQ